MQSTLARHKVLCAARAPYARYREVAALRQQYNKPVWCTEAGHHPSLWTMSWNNANPYESWENALRTAIAYERTLRLSGASQMDYWTYGDDYSLAKPDGSGPLPIGLVMRQMVEAFPPGSRVATTTVSQPDLGALPTIGPNPERFSLLLVNPLGEGQVTVTGLPKNKDIAVVQSTETAPGQKMSQALRTDHAGNVTLSLPARSVVTLLNNSPL